METSRNALMIIPNNVSYNLVQDSCNIAQKYLQYIVLPCLLSSSTGSPLKRTKRHVAVLVPSYQYYDRGLLQGIASFVKQSQLEWSVYLEDDPRVRLPNFDKWHGDGIITNSNNQKILHSIGRMDLPMVGLGGGYVPVEDNIHYAYVGTNHQHTARLAFEHLYDIGLRNFAYYGEPNNHIDTWSAERCKTLQHCANEAGCPCAVLIAQHTMRLGSMEQMQKRLIEWLRGLSPPVGLMSSSDRRGYQVLEACRLLGARIPEDFAVIGVDNDPALCDLCSPPMTSVELNTHKIGYMGANILNHMMSGRHAKDQYTSLNARYVVARQSTDMMAIEDTDIANAIRFIRKHACDPIYVQDVLAAIPLSRSTLENRFKQMLGRSIHAEIRRIQIKQAKILLAETDLSLTLVSHRIGIKTVQYFTSIMQQETGITPAKFRSRARAISVVGGTS
jgi:LacI family transcriptional regulator